MQAISQAGRLPVDPLREVRTACRGGVAAAILFSFGVSALMLVAPLYMLQIYDRVLVSRSTESLFVLTLIVGVSLLVMAALDYSRTIVMVRIGSWLDRKLAPLLYDANVSEALVPGARPDVQSLRDLSTVRSFLSSPLLFAVFDAPWTPMFIFATYLLHWMLGAVALGGAVLIFSMAVLNEIATRRNLDAGGGLAIRDLNQAEMAVRNADVVTAMGMLPALVKRWTVHAAETDRAHSRASATGAFYAAGSKLVRLALQIGVLGTGAYLAINNDLTPGAIIAASILTTRALAPVEQTIGGWRQAKSTRSAYLRINRQLQRSHGARVPLRLPPPTGLLSVEDVSYRFRGEVEPTLLDLSFQVKPGECLAILGHSAAGKTTLMRTLVGTLPPDRGHVRLDGADIGQLSSADRNLFFGYLPQDIELFDGTVRDNISRMAEGNDEDVIQAAIAAGVHEMILKLPSGYQTQIGHGGASLSGGQRQRIGLARALYRNPALIVLDEPNASLDVPGEAALIEAIARTKTRGSTLVLVTHSAPLLRVADKLLVLSGGRIEHFGPRNDVLAKISAVSNRAQPAPAQKEA